jgi:rhodanese-related sulfurtransferase
MATSNASTPTARALVEQALAEVRSLTVAEAQALAEQGGVRFVDVREPAEVQGSGHLPGALLVPRGLLEFAFDPASPWHRAECRADGRLFVVYCGVGWRSALAAQSLQRLGIGPVANLDGGIQAWLDGGGGTETAAPPGT